MTAAAQRHAEQLQAAAIANSSAQTETQVRKYTRMSANRSRTLTVFELPLAAANLL